MGFGLAAGALSVWCFAKMPGGESICMPKGDSIHFEHMRESLTKDRLFRRFCIGISIIITGFTFLTTFAPLFMRDEIGLSAGTVVRLDISMFIGMTLSSYFWGWAADRYGSKPIMLCGPILVIVFPLLCAFLPRHHSISLLLALFATFVVGIAALAWNLGMGRYLYVTAVPPAKKTAYISVFYVVSNLSGAIGPIIAGWLLTHLSIPTTKFGLINISNYIIVMSIGAILIISGIVVLAKVPQGDGIPMMRFLRIFARPDVIVSDIINGRNISNIDAGIQRELVETDAKVTN